MDATATAQVAAVAALAEPTRRRLYDHVVRQPAAGEPGRGRRRPPGCRAPTAAFHLDRLVADGLLDVALRAPHRPHRPGRRAPRQALPAGRPRGRGVPARAALRPGRRSAGRRAGRGRAVGGAPRRRARPAGLRARAGAGRGGAAGEGAAAGRAARAGGARASSRAPRAAGSRWPTARSTPSRREHTELVCGMNLRLLDGVLDGVPDAGLARARLRPERRACAACGWSRPSDGAPAG